MKYEMSVNIYLRPVYEQGGYAGGQLELKETNQVELTTPFGRRRRARQTPRILRRDSEAGCEMKTLCPCVLALFLAGCGPLRGYKFASHGPGDTSAGDLTHAAEPGARVVVPKKAKPVTKGPFYISAFSRPRPDCKEVDHHVDRQTHVWACATR